MRPTPKAAFKVAKITNDAVFHRSGSWKREGYHCSRSGGGQELRESIPRELHLSSLCWTWETGIEYLCVLNDRRNSSERRWLSLIVIWLSRMQKWFWTVLLFVTLPSSSLETSLGKQKNKLWYIEQPLTPTSGFVRRSAIFPWLSFTTPPSWMLVLAAVCNSTVSVRLCLCASLRRPGDLTAFMRRLSRISTWNSTLSAFLVRTLSNSS